MDVDLTGDRKYFPPVAETEKPKEHTTEASTDENELAAKLPDPPQNEPTNPEEPSSKKQKIVEADDDFVVVDKEEATEA
jgi:hypothetical protein